MRYSGKRTGIMALAVCLATLVSGGLAFAQGKGGGKPPKDDAPVLPVTYAIEDRGNLGGMSIAALAANEGGYIVGSGLNAAGEKVAFVSEPGSVAPVDLNTLGVLVDPAAPGDIWIAESARDVNHLDPPQIVGRGVRQDGQNRVFVFDLATEAFTLLPLQGASNRRPAINDFGTVVFADTDGNMYWQEADLTAASWTALGPPFQFGSVGTVGVFNSHLNNNDIVVTTSYGPDGWRYESGIWDFFSGFGIANLNENGDFAADVGSRRKDVVRYTGGLLETIYTGKGVHAEGINNQGDVLFRTDGLAPQLYMDLGLSEPLVISIDDAVAAGPNTAADLDMWVSARYISQVSNRDGTGFPTLFGDFGLSADLFRTNLVVLTPVLPPE